MFLYHNLQKYNLPSPQSIFEIGYFCRHPEPFFHLAKELYPGNFKVESLQCMLLVIFLVRLLVVQWNPSNVDTLGAW